MAGTVEFELVSPERLLLSEQVAITEEKTCPVCHKRIGTSAFARYPSGTVTHVACARNRSVDPLTGERFSAF